MFDPNLFLNQTTDSTLSEKRVLIPEGEGYKAIILADKIAASKVDWDGGTFHKLTFQLEMLDDDGRIKTATHRDKNILRYDITLDLTEDGGGLDVREGMNVPLGRLRGATNQNAPGRAWSPSMLGGQIIMFDIKHKLDKNNELRENVINVRKVA